MSNPGPEASIIRKFMQNVFQKPGFFESNKNFLKNHLRQDNLSNNLDFLETAQAYLMDRVYLRNPQ